MSLILPAPMHMIEFMVKMDIRKGNGRDALGLNRIIAIVSSDNERSIKLLDKLGLRFERMARWPADGSEIKLYASEVRKTG